jgi:hypothetical protein
MSVFDKSFESKREERVWNLFTGLIERHPDSDSLGFQQIEQLHGKATFAVTFHAEYQRKREKLLDND